MPKFPKRQADIKALAIAMAFGYWNHAADFPSADALALAAVFSDYNTAKNAQAIVLAAVKLATEAKNASLKVLVESMKKCLKKSEVDVAANLEKLALIGWGPKASPALALPPGQPRNLHPVAEGQGMLWLAWNRPTTDSGGPIRNYIIERREQPIGGDEFGAWNIVGTALNNEINLTDQPRGNQLEYRVKAVNTTGQSNPSNIAAIVL